jgi:Putative zinc- or iron-chelating domain
MSAYPTLPCYPCPHASSCCAYGTTLTDEEAAAIAARHGPSTVYRTRWGEWRTRVRNRRCVFFRDNVCSIHAEGYYPAVCRGFPWTDAETGGPYEFDRTICPEFVARPELVALGLPARSRPAPPPTL